MSITSRLRRNLDRWADAGSQDAEDLRAEQLVGATEIAEAPDRERVVLRGRVRSVTLRPRDGVSALEAELYDGTGTVTLVWLGRRRITGIGPGRAMQVEGRIGLRDGEPVIFNPRYQLRPEGE